MLNQSFRDTALSSIIKVSTIEAIIILNLIERTNNNFTIIRDNKSTMFNTYKVLGD